MTTGRFIVVEGIDGAGTTTLSNRLIAHYRGRSVAASVTREPTPGPVGALIRQALTHRLVVPGEGGPRAPNWATMALLFAADRLDHLESEIEPLLAAGALVVCDRYDLSSLVYQSATALSASSDETERAIAWIRELNRRARRPDLTLVVDVSPELAAQRRSARGGASELFEVQALQVRLAAAYASAERFVPGDRIVHLDGAQTVEALGAQAVSAIDAIR